MVFDAPHLNRKNREKYTVNHLEFGPIPQRQDWYSQSINFKQVGTLSVASLKIRIIGGACSWGTTLGISTRERYLEAVGQGIHASWGVKNADDSVDLANKIRPGVGDGGQRAIAKLKQLLEEYEWKLGPQYRVPQE